MTEKNDLGIIWNVFYNWEHARNMKKEHDGMEFKRDFNLVFKSEGFNPSTLDLNIKDLKRYANNKDQTSYFLLY